MAKFNTGQSFADGDQVTGAKLNNIIGLLDIYSGVIADQASIAATVSTADLLLIADTDAGSSGAANKVTIQKLLNDTLTGGTFTNANIAEQLTYGTATGNRTISTSATITNGTISNATLGTTTGTLATITNLTAGTTTSTAANITNGTVQTLTASTATITGGTYSGAINSTTGTIGTLNSTTPTFLGAITASTNTINVGSGQIYKDSSGNVVIGTTSPLVVAGYTSLTLDGTTTGLLEIKSNGTQKGVFFNDGVTRLRSSGTLAFDANSTEAMRIDSSGNVGIGVTSPISSLHIKHATPTSKITLEDSSTNRLGEIGGGSDGNGGFLTFSVGNNGSAITEKLRIASNGEVYIAGTTDQGIYNLQVNGTGVWGAGAYVNGSDSRIKEDIQPIASGLDVVDKLNPVTYKYKETWSSDQSIQSGFIAQELLTALDGQIYVDGVVQQGGTDGYYSVAYQNLIPILAKAIQELKAENDSLKSRIEALEA